MFASVKNCTDIFRDYLNAGTSKCRKELAALARHQNERVRIRVAENPHTPLRVLELLSKDNCPDVRAAAGTNPATPFHVLFRLLDDADPNVRLAIAEEPATPAMILQRLTDDENPYVVARASKTLQSLSPSEENRLNWFSDQEQLQYA